MNLNDPDRRYKKGFLAYNRCDFEAALAVWKPMAKQGHAGAQYMLGFMYDNGEGVQCNLKKAADWYRLAAEQDDMLAQNSLGSMYESGEGVPENPSRAVDWYLMAAKKNCSFSQYALGMLYLRCAGLKKDLVMAKHWLRLAAGNGNQKAKDWLDRITGQRKTAAHADRPELIEIDTKPKMKKYGVHVTAPHGKKVPSRNFLESLPKGTIFEFPNGKRFPKLK